MSENLQTSNTFLGSKLWRVTFGVAIWRLWFWRNRFIFTKDYWESNNIAVDIKVGAAEIQRCNSFPLAADMARIEKWIRWIAPTWPWVKLNTDGAMESSGRAGAGGLIRDYRGVWQIGYSANLGVCSVTSAELWGLFHGLSIAWLYGFRRVIVEVDSKCVLQLVSPSSPIINEHFSLIQAIQELLRRDWFIQVKHIYWEANKATYFLTTYSFSFPLGLHCFQSIPLDMFSILNNDVSGVAHSRLVLF